jgi:hypothetical protein
MNNEFGKNVDGSDRDLIQALLSYFHGESEKNDKKPK